MPLIHPPGWLGDVSLIFVSLLVQGVPFLLLGALVGGLITAFVPVTSLLGRWPRHPLLSALSGSLFAFCLPACDCAVVPVVRRLLQKGIPFSAGVAYLLAAPTLNPICLASTFLAYRLGTPWRMLLLRAGGALVLALVAALLASRLPTAALLRGEVLLGSGSLSGDQETWMQVGLRPGRSGRRIATSLGIALSDFLSVTTLYVLGALCSALLQTFAPLGALTSHTAVGVPAAMSLAFALSLCSSADAFVVNAFAAIGVPGQLAFLWLGPIFNLRTIFVYRDVLSTRAIIGLGLVSVLLIWGMAFLLARWGLS